MLVLNGTCPLLLVLMNSLGLIFAFFFFSILGKGAVSLVSLRSFQSDSELFPVENF